MLTSQPVFFAWWKDQEISLAQITDYEIKYNLTVQLFHNNCEHFLHYLYNLHKMHLFSIFQKYVKGILKSRVWFCQVIFWQVILRFVFNHHFSFHAHTACVCLTNGEYQQEICRVKHLVLRPQCPHCGFSKWLGVWKGLAWFCEGENSLVVGRRSSFILPFQFHVIEISCVCALWDGWLCKVSQGGESGSTGRFTSVGRFWSKLKCNTKLYTSFFWLV